VLSVQGRLTSEKPPIAALRADSRPVLRRQPRTGGGTPEIPPLETLPPKEEGGEKAPTAAELTCKPTSDVALPCRPKGLSNDDFLKTGAPQEAFGYTRIPAGQKIPNPEVVTKPIGRSKRVVLQPTKATQVSCESFFTKAGPPFWRTVFVDANDPKQRAFAGQCGSSYFKGYSISPDGEKKISEAELEHCTDYKYAFDISIGCYANVVNDLAKKKTEFLSHEAAVEFVTKRAGRKPDTWMARYFELLEKSRKRDKRWHTAVEPKGPGLQPVVIDRSGVCRSRYTTEINEQSYPEVGNDRHPTPDVIK